MCGAIPLLLDQPTIQGMYSSLPEILEGTNRRIVLRVFFCAD